MAIHIQMSEEAEAEMKKAAFRNRVSSLAVCLACLLLGGLALYFTVIALEAPSVASFIPYVPPADDAPPTATPTVKQLTARASSPSSSMAPNVIVSSAPSSVAMADVDVPVADVAFGTGNDIDVGMGSALGTGIGSGGEGLGTTQGGGSTLVGTFYDLKQTANGAKTGMDRHKVTALLGEFITGGWDAKMLSKYYQSKQKLYASSFYLPSCKASYAPVAYNCADRVEPSAWVAVYRGKVKAPRSGKFRFVGTGDDTLIVRFNRKTVLESGWAIPSQQSVFGNATYACGSVTTPAGKKYYQEITTRAKDPVTFYKYNELTKWNRELGGLKAGDVFTVQEGHTYPIEILISEIPGGAFGFALLIEDVGSPTDKKTASGAPLLELFRTNFSEPTKESLRAAIKGYEMGSMECPPYDADSSVWVSVP